MSLQDGRTRSLLDQAPEYDSNEPKIAKNGKKVLVERTKKPLMMLQWSERVECLCKLASQTCARHFCMMHAPSQEVMAPKMPRWVPILYKFGSQIQWGDGSLRTKIAPPAFLELEVSNAIIVQCM